MIRRIVWWMRLLVALSVFASLLPVGSALAAEDPRFFAQTGYRIGDDQFWDYFQKRGGVRTFGYPVSRKFTFLGNEVQFFQRRIVQKMPGGGVGQLNLLDAGLMPYTSVNGAVIPGTDADLLKTSPAVGSPEYAAAILAWVRMNTPNAFDGKPVNFYGSYANTVLFGEAYPDGRGDPNWMVGINLEMWGVPTSRPAADPNNSNFVYQRFQRGVMHYDRSTGLTQGLLLADYLKQIILGTSLPPDLAGAARTSPYFGQYNNAKPGGLNRPEQLPNTNLKDAFEKEGAVAAPAPSQPAPQPSVPTRTTGLRYGFQAHMYFQNQTQILNMVKGAGFNWVKQQIRWADVEQNRGQIDWGPLDGMVNNAAAHGVNVMFSVVTSPRWSRADGHTDGPPDNYNDLASFLGQMAARYRGRVQAYEVWNEQNLSREWGGGRINAGAYVELLKVSYTAIKSADPNAVVISGALTPTGVNDVNIAIDDKAFLDQMYQYQGGVFKQYADAVGSHMAGYNNAPEDWVDRNTVGTPGFKGHGSFYFRRIDDLYEVMRKYGDNRQMWITEYHWAAATGQVPAGYEWTRDLSEDQAADFLARSIQSIRSDRSWVGAVFIWNLNFRTFQDYHKNETAIFGVLNPDWSPRQLYIRLRDMPK
ncbi:MAG: cellulase family glycosylhydrolase [Chloroflexi bacterium]|nr:cellulase family glycosylhydrolase [Chloroflexota bacterium]